MSEPGTEHCECSEERRLCGNEACDEKHPEKRFICTRPPGHDGPHSACTLSEHPVEWWEQEDGLRADGGGERSCTNCGKDIEDLPYEFWLFSTCRSCQAEPAPARWNAGMAPGTSVKWSYTPRWHLDRHPETGGRIVADGGSDRYQMPDGRPKATGADLYEHQVRIRVDDTQAPNGRVAIHVEHPDQDRGVRCFFRDLTSADVARSIRSHIRTEIDADLASVEVIDEAGVGLDADELLPDRTAFGAPDPDDVEIEVVEV